MKFLVSRITNPGIKRRSWKQSYPSVKFISNRLNKLPAYKSAGKRQSGKKKSTLILVLPSGTCCSLLSIFDSGTICPLSDCDKTKVQTFPQRKTKWKSWFSAKWCWFEVKWYVSYIWKSVSSLPLDSFSNRNCFELFKARLASRKNVNNKVLICAE